MKKRQIINKISPLFVVCLFCLFCIPVKAEQDFTYFAIDPDSYTAFQYFANLGASMVDSDVSIQSTSTYSGTTTGCIMVPLHEGYTLEDGDDPGINYFHYYTYNMVLSPCSGQQTNINVSQTNTDRVRWLRPKVKITSYTAPSVYDNTQALMVRGGQDFVLGFEVTGNLSTSDFSLLTSGTSTCEIKELRLIEYSSPERRYRLVIHNNASSGWQLFNIVFPSSITGMMITPLYAGHLDNVSDDMGRLLGYDTGVARLIEEGNDTSQQSSSELEDTNTSFTSSSSTLFNFENSFTGQMDDAMDQINLTTSGGLLSVSGFTNALVWVVNQFNSLISPAPIQGALLLILTFGLAMYLIGMK